MIIINTTDYHHHSHYSYLMGGCCRRVGLAKSDFRWAGLSRDGCKEWCDCENGFRWIQMSRLEQRKGYEEQPGSLERWSAGIFWEIKSDRFKIRRMQGEVVTFQWIGSTWNDTIVVIKVIASYVAYLSARVCLWGGLAEGLWSFQQSHSVSLSCLMYHNRAPCLSSSKAPRSWMDCQKVLGSPQESFAGQRWALQSLASTQTGTCKNKLVG